MSDLLLSRAGIASASPSAAVDPAPEPTIVDLWLRRQQDLSAVERFSSHHDALPAHGVGRYRDRLPATPPGPGQQYAFEVDLDACTGCKACVAACHSLNGLDEDEAWRQVGALHDAVGTGADARGSVTVTSSCHHCVDPACLQGCPANAYEKDPVTGIVRHLDDACIGCSYCTLTCPYEVPTFQPSLGIVRKCDMCSDRLAAGEAPACVQGCPQGAITIAVTSVADAVAAATADGATLVPSAPPSAITVPTTRYRTTQPVPSAWVATDRSSVHPSAGHAPLAVMLVLTQLAVGMTASAGVIAASGAVQGTAAAHALAVVGLATGLLALGASTLHLGRPLLAWRAVLGWRRSWLSREILAFGLFAGAGIGASALAIAHAPSHLVAGASTAAVVGGLAGVGCSIELYAVTGRRWWRRRTSAVRFGGTVVSGGAIGTAAVLSLVDPAASAPAIGPLAALAAIGLLASVAAAVVPLWVDARRAESSPDLQGTARLLQRDLRTRHMVRLACAALAGFLLALAASQASGSDDPRALLVLAAVAAVIGEHQDRRLFFLASVAPRMPGSPG